MRMKPHVISTYRSRIYLTAILLAASWLINVAHSEDNESGLFHRTLETSDGLPDNNVTALAQTSDGYLWVATWGGLVRYNGSSFEKISMQSFEGVKGPAVETIFHDSRGQLWVSIKRGPLIRINQHGGKTFTPRDGVFPEQATSITEDNHGAMWIAYPSGLCQIKDEKVTRFTENEGLPQGDKLQIISDAAQQLWLVKGKQISVFRDGTFKTMVKLHDSIVCIGSGARSGIWICEGSTITRFYDNQRSEKIARLPDYVRTKVLFEDPQGILWIGTHRNGLYRLQDRTLTHVSTSATYVSSLSMDHEQNLWVGTHGGGLNIIRPLTVKLITTDDGLPFSAATSVAKDDSGRIWVVGTDRQLARRQNGIWESVSNLGRGASCIAFSKKTGLWVGTRQQGLFNLSKSANTQNESWRRWTASEGLASNFVRSLLTTANGDLWIATDNPYRLQKLSGNKWTSIEAEQELGPIVALTQTVDGTIWLATSGGQIFQVHEQSLIKIPGITKFKQHPVRSLHATPDGSLWIGYAGEGLGWYKDGKYALITETNGLTDNFISQLLADDYGSLWIAANRGISEVKLEGLLDVAEGRAKWVRSRTYGPSEGLPNLHPARGRSSTAMVASDGNLWFSMNKGLVVVQPNKTESKTTPPPVLLEQVSMDDQPVALYGNKAILRLPGNEKILDLSNSSCTLHLSPDHRKLEFSFAALSFTSPENVRFRYKLKGFDSDWVDAGSRRSATYPQLSAGEYEFQVIACNHAGVWNKTGKSLAIEVAPFFWETLWFKISVILASVLLLGSFIWIFVRRRYKKKLQKFIQKQAVDEERARIARDIHDDMGSNLTRIMLLSRPDNDGSPMSETQTLPKIHATSRKLVRTMEEVVWAVNPVQDNFVGLIDYLSDYAQEFFLPTRVRCRLDIPINLPERYLSAHTRHSLLLAYKEALNNLIKHAEATVVLISLTIKHSSFTIQIEDNGKGLPSQTADSSHASTGGNGLVNMVNRLNEIGGSCKFLDGDDSGTIVKFEIPFEHRS